MIDDPSKRILSLAQCARILAEARSAGRKVVLTNGCFDLLHRGHLEYLRASANLGDFLLVAVNSDESVRALKGPSRPLQSDVDRVYAIASLRFVDAAFVFPGPRLVSEIQLLAPDVYTKAGDYTVETLDQSERAALEGIQARIEILPFYKNQSTTRLIEQAGN